MFACELLDPLSHLRDVQHAIDLVPGATLLNLPHYCLDPNERIEVKRHVDE